MLDVRRKIRALAELQKSAKRVVVNVDRFVELNDVWVLESCMDLHFPISVFDVRLFGTCWPIGVDLMDLRSNPTEFLGVISLNNLDE